MIVDGGEVLELVARSAGGGGGQSNATTKILKKCSLAY